MSPEFGMDTPPRRRLSEDSLTVLRECPKRFRELWLHVALGKSGRVDFYIHKFPNEIVVLSVTLQGFSFLG
jgi:hypothetical protein